VLRQLDQRDADGLTVTLEWDTDTGDLSVRCKDDCDGDRLPRCFRVDPQNARFAFLYPSALRTLEQIRSLVDSPSSGSAHLAHAATAGATGGRLEHRHRGSGAADSSQCLSDEYRSGGPPPDPMWAPTALTPTERRMADGRRPAAGSPSG
jgi:hypothetical protein